MDISRLQERITIQENAVTIDAVHNHKNEWIEYYSCYAYPSTYTENETEGVVDEGNQIIVFHVHSCAKTNKLTSTDYRVIFNNFIYNIVSIDFMNYKFKEIKIRAKKVKAYE